MKLEKSDPQLETIVSRILRGELDLQPDFQRGEVWDRKRRQRLVDTILRDWYVPAIHIVVNPDGNEVVLDGQQRLVAIRDFILGELKVDGKIDPPDERIQALDGLKYDQLPEQVQRAVMRFVIPQITLSQYEPQEPNELFFRLNQSYNLTPPEKRNALHGTARDQIKELVRDLGVDGLGLLDRSKIGFSNGRLAYDDIIARTCVAIEMDDLRRHINNNVVEEFYRTQTFAISTIDGVRTAAEILLAQIEDSAGRVKFNKGTLQTWLVYCFWAPQETGDLPRALLAGFEEDRARVRTGFTDEDSIIRRRVLDVVSVYDDRASYRVTDVSSVLSRDLAIHLYSQIMFKTPERLGTNELVSQLIAQSSRSAQPLLAEFLDRSGWGEPLLNGRPQ